MNDPIGSDWDLNYARAMESDYPTNEDIADVLNRIADLLEAQDANPYREKTIAPRRFNPEGNSWLPIMHTEMQGWRFTALYSNTARAHDLGKTGD